MKIIECPRDAMQGVKQFIPTSVKIKYINQLLKVGFDTIDFGSFVSPKTIPQLKDTSKVLKGLDLTNTSSNLLAIIANTKGANNACAFEEINYIGFPLSVSEEFQKRNTKKTINQALKTIEDIQNLLTKHNKQLVVYLSMAFGNPYNEYYHPDIAANLTEKLNRLEVNIIALSDTIGVSNSQNISNLFSTLVKEYPKIEFGAHFHTNKLQWKEKVDAAYNNGCRRFDTAIKGYGGCPMAKDELIGNMPTEKIINYFSNNTNLNLEELDKCMDLTNYIWKNK